MIDWKEHYAAFYPSLSDEELRRFDVQVIPVKPKPKAKPKKVKEQKIDWIAVIRQMAYLRQQEDEQKKRALDIRQVPAIKVDEASLSSRIFQVLLASETPLHINHIIERVESLGWKSTSIHHKYSQFQHTLSDCYYMFEKVGVGTYTIRVAYTNKKPTKPAEIKARVSYANTGIATLKDLIVGIVKEYDGMTPEQVRYSLFNELGLWLSYSAVWRALQDERFRRDKDGYRVC